MAWTIDVKLDRFETEGRTDVGTITATWTEPDGSTFTFSRPHDVSEAGQAKFMALAEAALLKWQGRAKAEKPIATAMTATANKAVTK